MDCLRVTISRILLVTIDDPPPRPEEHNPSGRYFSGVLRAAMDPIGPPTVAVYVNAHTV